MQASATPSCKCKKKDSHLALHIGLVCLFGYFFIVYFFLISDTEYRINHAAMYACGFVLTGIMSLIAKAIIVPKNGRKP